MPVPTIDPGDLLDLKLMPAWVKEPSTREDFTQYKGEELPVRGDAPRIHRRDRRKPVKKRGPSAGRKSEREERGKRGDPRQQRSREFRQRDQAPPRPERPLEITVQFLPRTAVLDNVLAQVKAESLAYSLFFLARSFLEKPQRYEVALKAKPESPLHQIGEDGAVSADRGFLESNAFRLAREDFYKVEVTQSEPVKGNFGSVARCRLSGTMLGPTNHHDYQRKLRSLYEQRFSRRMSFAEYQRQIEIVSDPAAVEQWKEEARNITTFVTVKDEPQVTLPNAAEAERHFRQNHLPNLIRPVEDLVIDGVTSRQLPDRKLGRHIEQAWAVETRSPSRMMQELSKRFRDAGLHIFRHKRGMLFVSSVRARPLIHDDQNVSTQVKAILDLVAGSPRIRRKDVADKLLTDAGEELETRKLALASDLHWLISEGYLIEFNDGALDLPRTKVKEVATGSDQPGEEKKEESVGEPAAHTVETEEVQDAGAITAEVVPATTKPEVEAIDPNRHSESPASETLSSETEHKSSSE